MTGEDAVSARVLAWPGEPAGHADAVALRLAGGLHALVLKGAAPDLAAAYADPAAIPDDRLLTTLLLTLRHHQDVLLAALDQPPQTNEVRRSAVLIAAGHWLTARYGLPLVLSELGASAGLNLIWDQYLLNIGGCRFGPPDATLMLTPDWAGPMPPSSPPRIAERAGVDLNPLDPVSDRARILSYIWADQTDRIERTRIALRIAASVKAPIERGDAAEWLGQRLTRVWPGAVHLVFHTVAWQYFPAQTRDRCTASLAQAGSRATKDAPVAHLSYEADATPGSAAVRLTLWPGGETVTLGRADFHGRSVRWTAPDAFA